MSLPAFSILQVFGKSAFSLKPNFKGLILSSFLTAASNSPYIELSGFHFQGILIDKKTKNEVWSKREPAAVFRYISVCQMSHTPITAHAGVSQAQEHRLQHVWEIQKIDMKLSGALNRMLKLMPTKTGSKQRKIKKGSVTHHVCPTQVTQLTSRCRTQMDPAWHPRHCWRSACRLARGAERWSLLKKVPSGKAPPLWRAKPYLCTGSPPLPPNNTQGASCWNLEAGTWWEGSWVFSGEFKKVRHDKSESICRKGICRFKSPAPLWRDLGRSPGEVLRAFKQQIDSSMCNSRLSSLKGDLNQLSWQHTQEMKGYKHHLLYSGTGFVVSIVTLSIF